MKCYNLQIVVCVICLVILKVKCVSFVFPSETSNELGGNCTIVYNKYLASVGKCTYVSDCTLIKLHLNQHIYNHTVCGFIGFDQIVCCPDQEVFPYAALRPSTFTTNIVHPTESGRNVEQMVDDVALIQSPRSFNRAEYNAGFDCLLNENFDKGVLKFVNDCPEHSNIVEPQEVCNFDICSDLVCCPVKQSHKLKPKCRFVDDPIDELRLRLHLNQPCTIENTNQMGRFQHVCDAIAPNETTNTLKYACNNKVCRNWFCCPITKSIDNLYCIRPDSLHLATLSFIGPHCIDSKSGKPGRCRKDIDCPGFRKDLDICGSKCCVNFYCCPDVDYAVAPIPEKMCLNYLGAAYTQIIPVDLSITSDREEICSGVELPVAEGSPTKPGEYAHMAALGYIPKGSFIYWNCAGSLISDKYVLTSSHCLSSRSFESVKIVRLGVILLNKYQRIDDCPEDFHVSQLIPYPGYNSKTMYHDIGLIRLERAVQFNFHIRPICLPSSFEIPQYLIGMGWGLQGSGDEKHESLIQVFLEQYTHTECADSFRFTPNLRYSEGIFEQLQMCAGTRNITQSACSGDSGGPLLNKHKLLPRMHVVYAISSFGSNFCEFSDRPSVYTKVYPYMKWIENIVWN